MFSGLILMAATLAGQYVQPLARDRVYGYGYQTPLPYYDPAGYHRRYPEWVGSVVSGVGNPRTINLPGVEQTGRVESVDFENQLITLRLPTETVRLHYGPRTYWDGTYEDLKPGTVLSFNESKHRITIIGGQVGTQKR
jgi:hypothetical protein